MNSSFFNDLGLGYIDIGMVLVIMAALIVLLLIINIVNICSLSKLKKKYQKFMSGKSAKSLEAEIVALFEDNKFIKNTVDKNKKDIRTLYKRMESAFQKIGIIKYDAFGQMGGNLSFSLALLDENNNGFIINSVHSAEGCYSYTKQIIEGKCDIALGEEEKQALNMAIGPVEE